MSITCTLCRSGEFLPASPDTAPPPLAAPDVCWFHRLKLFLTSPAWPSGLRLLVIVARNEPALFARVSEQFLHDARVHVLVDRRRGDRRLEGEGHEPQWIERRHPKDARLSPEPILVIPTWVSDEESSAVACASGNIPDPVLDSWRPLEDWMERTSVVLTSMLPAVLKKHDEAGRRVRAADEDVGRLAAQIDRLRRDAESVRASVAALHRQRREVAAAVAVCIDAVVAFVWNCASAAAAVSHPRVSA